MMKITDYIHINHHILLNSNALCLCWGGGSSDAVTSLDLHIHLTEPSAGVRQRHQRKAFCVSVKTNK